MQGELAGAVVQFDELIGEAEAAHDGFYRALSLSGQGIALAFQGDVAAARAAADAAVDAASELGGIAVGNAYLALIAAALVAGDAAAAQDATEMVWQHHDLQPATRAIGRAIAAQAALAGGDLVAARRLVDDALTKSTGWYLIAALTTRARVAIAQREPEQAERDVHSAFAIATELKAYLYIPDALECLAALAKDAGSHREATRLAGAAHGMRQLMGSVRLKVWDADYEAAVVALRNSLGENEFDAAWAEGVALSTEEAIAYAQRGRGERKRPASGWASLTPAELDVVRLVSEGLGNNDIATRLFVSPRTVQSHLTHVYAKLGLASRVQLAQEAARHA
jgi:DNA-binding CsgD family transcriptional regulator